MIFYQLKLIITMFPRCHVWNMTTLALKNYKNDKLYMTTSEFV